MSGAFKGREIDFTWGGSEILGVRQKGIALAGDPIDISSDEDTGWRTLLGQTSQDQVDISLSGVTKSGVLRRDYFTGDRTKPVTVEYPDGSVIQGTFVLVNYNETGVYNDAVTFDASIQSTGPVTYLPYS
ncbi:MAG: phage tail tube protein [Phycisphaerales bacterium]